MKTRLWCLVALLLLAAPVRAQNPIMDSGSITAVSSGGACSAAPAGCAVFTLPNGVLPSLTLQVSGTYSATLLFEATSDGTNWKTITGISLADGSSATGTTTTGQFSFQNSGLTGIRVRCTAYTSGTAVVTAVRGYASAKWLTPFVTALYAGDGTAAAPSYSFKNDTTSGLYYTGTTGKIGFGGGGVSLPLIRIGGDTSAFPALRRNGAFIEGVLADESAYTFWSGKGLGFAAPGSGFLQGTAAGVMKFQNAGATTAFTLQVNTAPTCTSNCGTSPSLAGTDSAGIVTMGASGVPASGWVVTFGSTWGAAPSCSVTSALTSMVAGKAPIAVQTSTTTMTVTTNGTAPATSDKYAYQCFGVS